MSVAKVTEITSTSTKSFEEAIRLGIDRANKTLRNVTGAWVQSQKIDIEKGKITQFRVAMRVTFLLED
jgi:flavin-binding protein dodecin